MSTQIVREEASQDSKDSITVDKIPDSTSAIDNKNASAIVSTRVTDSSQDTLEVFQAVSQRATNLGTAYAGASSDNIRNATQLTPAFGLAVSASASMGASSTSASASAGASSTSTIAVVAAASANKNDV